MSDSEAKLGKGAMDSNIAQHQEMLPKFDKWADLCSKILSKDAKYDPTEFTNLLRESTDLMYTHLVDEIPTMEVCYGSYIQVLLCSKVPSH